MKRFARSPIGLCIVYAALCGAAAWSVGDDALEAPTEPMPLFSPPDSLRPLQGSEGISRGANVESKEELYERLRQSLLNLEHRLQQPAPVAAPQPIPNTTSPPVDGSHEESGHSTAEDHGDDPMTAVPLFNPMPGDPAPSEGASHADEEGHADESVQGVEPPHVDVQVPDPHDAHATPTETEAPHESELPHEDESSHQQHTAPATEDGHGTESPFVSHPGSDPGMPSISPEALSSPNLPALADNLYALGEYQLAHGSYQEIDRESLPEEDKVWVTYQIAGCLRHMGESESAASLYRQILADHDNHYLANASRWWLDAMDEYTEQTQAVEALRTTLQQIEETRDAPAAP